ncbi:MAG: SGNH/GDSL hydrolase family protein [Elusimicrobiota bacterium]
MRGYRTKLRALALIAPLAASVGALIGGEWAARRWVDQGDALDRVGGLLRMDVSLGWRQKENVRIRFMGVPVATNSQGLRAPESSAAPATGSSQEGSVLVLGPSSTFGWGVPESGTYARRLEAALREGGRRVSVVNAGQIGFSSWQGLRFYDEEFRRLPPRVLVLAYGANDVDRYRFFFQDRRPDSAALEPRRSAVAVAVRNTLRDLAGLRWLSRTASGWRGSLGCLPDGTRPPYSIDVPSLRVPPEEFAAGLDLFARRAREDGASLVLMTTPYRLERRPGASAENEAKYRRSSVLAAQGLCEQAREAFEQARSLEPYRIASSLDEYNEIVRRSAARLGVPLVDVERLLSRDESLFVDPIHPSGEGHRRIARILTEAVRPLMGE